MEFQYKVISFIIYGSLRKKEKFSNKSISSNNLFKAINSTLNLLGFPNSTYYSMRWKSNKWHWHKIPKNYDLPSYFLFLNSLDLQLFKYFPWNLQNVLNAKLYLVVCRPDHIYTIKWGNLEIQTLTWSQNIYYKSS